MNSVHFLSFDFIFSLGIVFNPIFAIYVIDFFIVHKGQYNLERIDQSNSISLIAIVAWLVGIVVAYGAEQEWYTLTHIVACDSLLIAGMTYYLLNKGQAILRATPAD